MYKLAIAALAALGVTSRPPDDAAELRRLGPAALDALLARYDATPDGTEKRRLEDLIDRVAAQRYAYVSRLFWHTDLDQAKAEARRAGKPILSLRLLGRLDEDYSCANSRFFRVALYANAEVSRLLRDEVVLHWSSERPAPRVVIDMGDGRRLQRTVAGNSVHYLLDAEGRPVTAIPGLYGPAAFRRELAAAVAAARTRTVADYHRRRIAAIEAAWRRDGARLPLGGAGMPSGGALGEAERVTVGKAAVEMPVVAALRLGPQAVRVPDDAPVWEALGRRRAADAKLDARSRTLMRRRSPTDRGAAPRPLDEAAFEQLVGGFERRLAADTALNEYRWAYEIYRWFATGNAPARFEDLNRRIYSELFLTPADDAWLGMATPGDFVGLPADGIALAR